MPCTVSIIIPYYQRERGILSRALASVGQQSTAARLEVIIVDDASPSPPEPEIAAANLPADISVRVVKVPNGGPGAARNIGIDLAMASGADFIAFLDSDDSWLVAHLDEALRGLQGGSSFYFCDNKREHQGPAVSIDEIWPGWRAKQGVSPADGQAGLYEISSADAVEEFLRTYLSQTSTVVYRAENHKAARFDPDLRSAGEDHLMWVQMAFESSGVSFSPVANVVCGEGVNICFSAYDWAMPETRNRIGYQALFYSKLNARFPLTQSQRAYVRAKRSNTLALFGYVSLRQAVNGDLPPIQLVGDLASSAPADFAQLPYSVTRLALMGSSKRTAWAAEHEL